MGRTVTSVATLDGSAGTSSRARLALTGDGLPESVFVKMSAGTAAVRMLGELANLGENESSALQPTFAGTLWRAEDVRLRVRFPYWSICDRAGGFAAGLREFYDTLRPIDRDKAALLVELLAHVHGTFWNRLPAAGRGGPFGWLTATADERSLPISRPLMRLSAKRLADKTSIPIEDGRFVIENYPAAVRLIETPPHTVLHGDSHPGNSTFGTKGGPARLAGG